MNDEDLIACPRCHGTWWRNEVFNQLPRPGVEIPYGNRQTAEMEAAIMTGKETPFGCQPYVVGSGRVLVVCGQCSFPKIEPKEDTGPGWGDLPQYELVRR